MSNPQGCAIPKRKIAFWPKCRITRPTELLFHEKLFLAISIDFGKNIVIGINFNGILFFHFGIRL